MATQKPTEKRRAQLPTMQLVVKPPTRKSSDVGAWRTALQSADMGRVKALYDLFEDLLIDGVLADAVDKRIGAVTNSPITFQDDKGQEVPEIAALIDSPDFEELLTTIMNVRFWGRAAGEFTFGEGVFGFTGIPFKHIKLENTNILINETDDSGVDYSTDDHILVVGKQRDFGLFLKTAPYVIWKRGGFGDYAQWIELFGMPQRVGKYSSYDPESRRLLEQAMEQAGSAPWIVIPKEADVETVTSASTGSSGSTHNEFRKACNEEILITILGQTMTTLDGSSKSQSETHKAVEEGKNRSDMRFVRRVLNWVVIPMLEKRGFPVTGGKFVFPESAEELSVTEIVALCDVIDIPVKFLHEKYSIPVAEAGEPVARKASASSDAGAGTTEPVPDPAKPEKPKKPVVLNDDPEGDDAIELRDQKTFWKGFFDFFAVAPQVGASNGSLRTSINLADTGSFNDADFLKRFYDEQPDFDIELFSHISTNLISRFRKGWAADPVKLADIGIDYGLTSEAAQTAMETNLFHFSAAKTLAECQELNSIFRKSKSFDEFAKEATVKHEMFNRKWAETEYDTAELTAESSATYHRLKAQTDIFPFWAYMTQNDGKVRDSHRPLHGLTLPANDPRWGQIYPPNGWKDRCYVVARTRSEGSAVKLKEQHTVADNFIDSGEFKKAKAQGWGVNRSETQQVFTENQMYIRKFPGKASKEINNLGASDYSLNSVSTSIKSAEKPAKAKLAQTAMEWWQAQKKADAGLIVSDYNKRRVVLSEKVFNAYSSEAMGAYMDAVTETLASPHEVWLSGNALDEMVSVRFYSDEIISAVCKVDKGKLTAVSEFGIVKKSDAVKARSGLLIKKHE